MRRFSFSSHTCLFWVRIDYVINFHCKLIITERRTLGFIINPWSFFFSGLCFFHSPFFYRLDWRFIHCFRVYYSMIVATRPDPTVRPPSRYQTSVLQCANGDFSCDLYGKIRIFHCVRMVFGDFVIIVLSQLLYIAPLV